MMPWAGSSLGKKGRWQYTLLQTQGQLNNTEGILEYVLNPIGQVAHQRFIPGGIYTGFANQVVPRGGY